MRQLQVLGVAQRNALQGVAATQRDVYYTLADRPGVPGARAPTAPQVYAAIDDAAACLDLSRGELGVKCASKGLAAGRLRVRLGAAPWRDGTAEALHVPGDLSEVLSCDVDLAGARAVLVVEKEAVFARLVEERLWERHPVALLTAKGVPDVATRALLWRLHSSAPLLPVLGAVDFNPHGLVILSAFLLGGRRRDGFAAPVQLLGARAADVARVRGQIQCRPLSPLDLRVLSGCLGRLHALGLHGWDEEAEAMRAGGVKAELECLSAEDAPGAPAPTLSRTLAQRIMRREYVSPG